MISLEEWREEALNFETQYVTLVESILKLDELKITRKEKSKQLDRILNGEISLNPIVKSSKEVDLEKLQADLDQLDRNISSLEKSIPKENIETLYPGEIAHYLSEVCDFRNRVLASINEEYSHYAQKFENDYDAKIKELNKQINAHKNTVEAWKRKGVEESDINIRYLQDHAIKLKTDKINNIKEEKAKYDFLKYLYNIEKIISNVAEWRNKYSVGEFYYALVYCYDKIYEPIDGTNKSKVRNEAERYFNKALEYVKKYCDDNQMVIYSCTLAKNLGVERDVAVELKNMLIESEILCRHGGINTHFTEYKINNLLQQDKLNQEERE